MKNWILAGLIGATLATVSCGEGYVGVYATTPPPPVRVETFGPAPGPGFVWINGYYAYRGGGYAWVPGRWERPPRGRHRWEDGRWGNRGNRYYWREGHWR